LVRVCGIFTTTTISPSPSWRQYSCRYAIRAGRNLPDKEFRYLRTVIVTAALHWRFGSQLHVPTAGKRQSLYVVFDDFAETCVFSKQSQLSFSCGPLAGASLIANLRDQFAEFLHVWFSRAPEAIRLALLCQIWYGHRFAPAKVFLDGLPVGSPHGLLTLRRLRGRVFLSATPDRKPASNSRTTFDPPSLLVQR
jgi:hypothetical protein